MAKKKTDKEKELTLEESLIAVKRIAKSNKLNEELDLLKKASATLAKELQPEFEFEEDEGGGGPSVSEELTKPPGFFEQMGSQVSNLGAAGVIALASAAYFQVDTVVEETRTVAAVAEEKWEEVKFEHPNINWDDPLAGFTTILGVGEIDIDLEPPKPKESQTTTSSSVTPKSGEKTDETETAVEETESEIEETETESEAEETEEQEEKPKKKKGLFGLFGGDDEESEEEAEEVEEETEAKEESSEPEPEAEEEQVKEKPKKKSGGLFSAFFGGGDDEESEEPEDENREEPTQDDQVPEEQKDETEVDAPETKEVAKTTTNDSNKSSVGITVEKKSSGGLLSLFGFNTNEEEVVEESEISTDEEPVIEVAVAESDSEAPQISEEVVVEANVEVNNVEVEVVAVDSGESFEINISEMSEMDIEFIAEAIDNGQLEVANLNIDDVVEEVVEQVVIEKVVTPIDTGNGEVNVVSPAGPADDLIWADIFGPNAPGRLSDSESDATPI